jgi:hypothetical protein
LTAESVPREAIPQLLRALNLRSRLHPDDVFAFYHPDRADFDQAAARNVAMGNTVFGLIEADGRLVQVVDVTPQLRAQGCAETDPRLPDKLTEPCCDLHGRNCEPPSELCCYNCTEADHPGHLLLGPCSSPIVSPDRL